MGFILSFIAIIIFVFVHFLNGVIVLFVNLKARAYPRTTNKIFYNSARDLDIYGNYAYKVTWDLLFKKSIGYDFGAVGETISSALGKNQRDKTLTFSGWVMVYLLWILDPKYWFKGGHCINSITYYNE